jgi:two-component system, NtrC family, nitrogen regulation sensor histidine kinase NtrY
VDELLHDEFFITTMTTFRLQCAARILALTASIAVLAWLVMTTKLYATMLICAFVCIGEAWLLVRFVEQTNRQVVRFLESVKYGDTVNVRSAARLGGSFAELGTAFGAVVQDFERMRTEKEEQYLALQTLLHHVSIGLLSYDSTGVLDFINPAARKLLGIGQLHSLHTLPEQYKPLQTALFGIQMGVQTGVQTTTQTSTKPLVKLVVNDEILQLSLNAAHFRQRGREMTLVSLHNIVQELDEQESAAWQKLMRVLTHEIMNSVAPITSLADTISTLLTNDNDDNDVSGNRSEHLQQHTETLTDVRFAAATIARRSAGLLEFVENYRKLARVPEPNFAVVPLAALFERVCRLTAPEAKAHTIVLEWSVEPPSCEVLGDEALLEQVFINLVQNAMHALVQSERTPKTIVFRARQSATGRTAIEIQDNGTGIVPDALEKIFVPFFTTKPDGSGIGLSVVRQVLRKHGASITVSSSVGVGTTFHIRF